MKMSFPAGLSPIFALLAALPAQAGNIATFTGNGGPLTSSVLAATIAASHVDFHPEAGTVYQGNQITGATGGGGFGIIAVNQNTGINAVNQQAITVRIGKLTLPVASQ